MTLLYNNNIYVYTVVAETLDNIVVLLGFGEQTVQTFDS